MRATALINALMFLVMAHGDCEILIEIKTPTALDPSFQAVASKPQEVSFEETGNSPPVFNIKDWKT